MKKLLDLAEFKLGKDSADFKYFKKQTMDYVYDGLRDLFNKLEEGKVIVKCGCNSKIRQGYADCPNCNGCGYKTKE